MIINSTYYLQITIFKRLYLFILERGREGERKGEKYQCVVASHKPPTRDLARNPGMCPRLGIELVTLWFAGQHSIHLTIPARATNHYFKCFI